MKKFCFVGTAIQYATKYHTVAKAIAKESGKDIEYCFVTFSKESSNYFKKNGLEHVYMHDVIKKIKIRGSLRENLKRIEQDYDVDVNLLLFGDYEHSKMNKKRAFTLLVKYFLFWEDYLANNDIDYILSGIERLKNMVPRIVSNKYTTKYYAFKGSQIKNRFEVNDDPTGHISKLDKFWKKNKNKKLSAKDRKEAERFLDDITKIKKRTYILEPPKIFGKITFFFKRLLLNIFVERFRNPYANLFYIASFQAKKSIRKFLVNHLYEVPDYNEKIIFYPLHVEHDAQILVRAPKYANQLSLVETISKYIPRNHKLFLKEHPNNIGGTSIKKLKKMKQLSNVRLVSPDINSHDLIKKSSLVITINSTVGFEALLYGKPVVVLGTPFYEISGMTYNVKDIKDLRYNIYNALTKKLWDKEILLRFINAVIKSTYPGLAVFQGKFREEAMSSDNLKLVGKGISEELKL